MLCVSIHVLFPYEKKTISLFISFNYLYVHEGILNQTVGGLFDLRIAFNILLFFKKSNSLSAGLIGSHENQMETSDGTMGKEIHIHRFVVSRLTK